MAYACTVEASVLWYGLPMTWPDGAKNDADAAVAHEKSLRSHGCPHVSDPVDIVTQTRKIHEANTPLEKLDLGENKVGDAGALALAEALKAAHVLCGSCTVWPLMLERDTLAPTLRDISCV